MSTRRDDWVEDDIVMEDGESKSLRPYLVTGGRTRTEVDGLAFETLVEKPNGGLATDLRFESAKVIDLCDAPISVAEISAHLSIPLGSAMVLIGDLIGAGHLKSHKTFNAKAAPDSGVSLIKRIIAGVKQL